MLRALLLSVSLLLAGCASYCETDLVAGVAVRRMSAGRWECRRCSGPCREAGDSSPIRRASRL